MSSVSWRGNHLIQRWREESAELGFVEEDTETGKVTLWLKDTCGVVQRGTYMLGGKFDSMAHAGDDAIGSPAAGIMHHIWLRQAAICDVETVLGESWDEISPRFAGAKQERSTERANCETQKGAHRNHHPRGKCCLWGEIDR